MTKVYTRREILKKGALISGGLAGALVIKGSLYQPTIVSGAFAPAQVVGGGVELLVHSFSHSKTQKGSVQTVRNVAMLPTWPWGRKEGLPNFVIIRLTDVNAEDVSEYTAPWLNKVNVELSSQNETHRRYIFTISKTLITEFGESKGITPEMILYLITNSGATQTTVTTDRSRLDLLLPQDKWEQALVDIQDFWEEQVSPRRFRLAVSDVDAALANGGRLTTTFAAIDSRKVDREA